MKKIFEYPDIQIMELAHRDIMLDLTSSPDPTKVTFSLSDSEDLSAQYKIWRGFKKR